MKETHFDAIAGVYDDSLPAHVVEPLPEQTGALHPPALSLRAAPWTWVVARGCWPSASQKAGYDCALSIPPRACLTCCARERPPSRRFRASGTALPYPDDGFELVCCVAVMHHVALAADVRATLAEMVRVTRPGGRVLVWDHNPRNPYWSILMARVPQDTGDERLIPEEEVVAGLQEAEGASIQLSATLGLVPDFTPPRAISFAAAIERGFERTPGIRRWAAHNVVLATKHSPAVAQP